MVIPPRIARDGEAAAENEYSAETRAQLTTLYAFRFGLQLLEHELRLRNECLNLDPSATHGVHFLHSTLY
jgi:hypothetical protein